MVVSGLFVAIVVHESFVVVIKTCKGVIIGAVVVIEDDVIVVVSPLFVPCGYK